MNTEMLKGKWNDMRGEILNTWGKLTGDELDQTKGNVGSIVGLIQQKYGQVREDIMEKLNHLQTHSGEKTSHVANEKTTAIKEDLRQDVKRDEEIRH